MQNREIRLPSGWTALSFMLLWLVTVVVLIVLFAYTEWGPLWFLIIPLIFSWFLAWFGFIVNSPNQSRVIQLFGKYVGTLTDVGFFYGNPFYWRTRVSLRVRTFETGMTTTEETSGAGATATKVATTQRQQLKVNDLDGTPIEIAAVITWRVVDSSQAVFQVDNYEDFVHIQADAALRGLASRYSYDAPETDVHSLRGHIDEVGAQLQAGLQSRVQQAGVEVLDSRISYLAYAPEIAAAMLQRQQAGAIIAARSRIVEGAVGMVEHALEMLTAKGIVEFDPDRRAAMVSNLLVVLCGHAVPQPVLNTGTIHH
jgi:regulator of protease activity HflC (stomatin/prohibitin superfamily)